jgi:hypothetical protein
VIGYFSVRHLVDREFLALTVFIYAYYRLLLTPSFYLRFYPKEVLPVPYILLINGIKIAFSYTNKVDSIQQIGFA